jgi:hypothetical protein
MNPSIESFLLTMFGVFLIAFSISVILDYLGNRRL